MVHWVVALTEVVEVLAALPTSMMDLALAFPGMTLRVASSAEAWGAVWEAVVESGRDDVRHQVDEA